MDLDAYRKEIIGWPDSHEKIIAGQMLVEFYKERQEIEQEQRLEARQASIIRSQNRWFREFMEDRRGLERDIEGAIRSALANYGGQINKKHAAVVATRAAGNIYARLRRFGGVD